MAKFCGNCGLPLNETANFCGACGTRVPKPASAPETTTFTPPAASVPVSAPPLVPPVAVDPAPWQPTAQPTPEPWQPTAQTTPEPWQPTAQPTPEPWQPATQPTSEPWQPTPVIPPVAAEPAPWQPVTPPTPPAFEPVQAVPPAANPTGWQPVSQSAPPVTPPGNWQPPPSPPYGGTQAAYPAAYPPKKSNTLLKVVLVIVVLGCMGVAMVLAGLYYAARKVSSKVHEAATQLSESDSPGAKGLGALITGGGLKHAEGPNLFKGDPCRFLTKEEVSRALGVTVLRTEAKDTECNYIAKGDPADATAKHAAQMLGNLGADAQTQKTIQKFAGALFAQQEASDKDLSAEAAKGEIPVLVIDYTYGNATAEMNANRGAFQRVTGGSQANSSASGDVSGIGDEAYVAGGSMLMVRKGNTVARFLYVSCPCSTSNVEPLARSVASHL